MPLMKIRVSSVISTVLIGTACVGMAFAAGAYSSRGAMGAATDFRPHKEVRPAHKLRMIGKSLELQCGRSPNGKVTMDREDVERLYSLALQTYDEEQYRIARARHTPP
jgi:hypothetical protein